MFDHHLKIDPAGAIDEQTLAIPARWCVIMLTDADDRPVQLLCAKNVRALLRRRLSGADETEGPSRKIDYRALVRGASWRRVDSTFEMDLIYLKAARTFFPDRWKKIIPQRTALFVSIDETATHPKFQIINDPTKTRGATFGPFTEKSRAERWIEAAQDCFDLCRYHNILVQAPNGRACTYKEISRCLAPCDGSQSMEDYRSLITSSIRSIDDPTDARNSLTNEMKRLAGEMNFEQAGVLKQRLDRLTKFVGLEPHVRRIEVFRFLSIQPGPKAGSAKLFDVSVGSIKEIAGILDENADVSLLVSSNDVLASNFDTELVALAAHHLTSRKSEGQWIDVQSNRTEQRKAMRAVMNRNAPVESESIEALRES